MDHKKKSMTKEKASFVKKAGHYNEDEFALLIQGETIGNTGKTDVKKGLWNFSLKKECKRIQFALYSANSKHWKQDSEISNLCKACIDIYPPTFAEYADNKPLFKALLREKMIVLKDWLQNNDNVCTFFHQFITNNGEIHFVVMKDGDHQHIFDAQEVVQTLSKETMICNSQATKTGETSEQKVIVKYKNDKDKWKNLVEIEMRNSSPNHFAQFLCVCNRDDLFCLLKRCISHTTNIGDNIVAYGSRASNVMKGMLSPETIFTKENNMQKLWQPKQYVHEYPIMQPLLHTSLYTNYVVPNLLKMNTTNTNKTRSMSF